MITYENEMFRDNIIAHDLKVMQLRFGEVIVDFGETDVHPTSFVYFGSVF